MNDTQTDKGIWPAWAIFNALFAVPLSCVVLYSFIEPSWNTTIILPLGFVVITVMIVWQSLTLRKSAPSFIVALATAIGWIMSFVIVLEISMKAAEFFDASSQGGNAVTIIAFPGYFLCVGGVPLLVLFLTMLVARGFTE